eukprot:TRINITY_DN3134_c0_g1_i3.p1 TRINITY_DN3134_c0_g1~~TRINITY_DN3134_c0_g1_i3.p1  ORF type:complete len:592 (+),score=103.90 TRINITY_DN3134_c0_g1_i3:240-2015(+)
MILEYAYLLFLLLIWSASFQNRRIFFCISLLALEKKNTPFFEFGDGVPNWIAINQILLKIHTIAYQLRKLVTGPLKGNLAIENVVCILDDMRYDIFNDQRTKFFEDTCLDLLVLEKLSEYETHFTHLVNFVDVYSHWSSNDIPEDPDYLDPYGYNQLSFRNICKKLLPEYDLIEVSSDGNCFYRAVIKFLWSCPEAYQEKCCSLLREVLNPLDSTDERFSGFEVEGVSDAATMRQDGVWADHLQVLKLSSHMNRPVWLIRYDDREIKLLKTGELIPGPDYQIATMEDNSASNETPIVLYFIPEAHYEVLKPSSVKREKITISDAVSEIRNYLDQEAIPFSLIGEVLVLSVFELEEEVIRVENIFEMLGNMEDIYRAQLRSNLILAINSTRNYLSQFKRLVAELETVRFFDQLKEIPGEQLTCAVIYSLFSQEENTLDMITNKLDYYQENKNSKVFIPYGHQMDIEDEENINVQENESMIPNRTLNLSNITTHFFESEEGTTMAWHSELSKSRILTIQNGSPHHISLSNLLSAYNESDTTSLILSECNISNDCCEVLCITELQKPLRILNSTFPVDVDTSIISLCNTNISFE